MVGSWRLSALLLALRPAGRARGSQPLSARTAAPRERRLLGRTRTLDSHASRLRRKLTQAGAADCVLNVWGVGYRLLADYEETRRSA